MKKKYSKPYLAVESFQLDAAMAGSCSFKLGHAENTCTYWDDVEVKLLSEHIYGAACETQDETYLGGPYGIDVVGMGQNPDGLCYQTFDDGPYLTS